VSHTGFDEAHKERERTKTDFNDQSKKGTSRRLLEKTNNHIKLILPHNELNKTGSIYREKQKRELNDTSVEKT